ncbi:kinase-like domain-containing protein [Mycena albidolilacea]|uniref:non-specific serine/threonine protein kinase n=1 Tax=Mycena albidolilacea TaxID=1033008 RepID=A0AAD7ADY4_9AGAR|nr:kinase-like domain-containing protein [Mycena albidolilacea]
MASTAHKTHSIPLPPPEADAYDKAPGMTHQDLLDKSNGAAAPIQPAIATKNSGGSVTTLKPPPSIPASAPTSPTSPSAPYSPAAVKRAASAASVTSTKAPAFAKSAPNTPAIPSRAPSRAASVASDASGADSSKHRFTLKDLLASGPKLSRKSSARSASSRHSVDSDVSGSASVASAADHPAKKAKAPKSKSGSVRSGGSVGGDSAGSLSQKYGVCQKVAIGKGATSVVRLAHKWDRNDGGEKVYAVKEFRKRRKTETEKEYVKKLTAEFCISSTLHHVNIVETVDLVQDEAGRWCEVMEFCPGGDLYAAIKKGGMSPSEVECCFKQILCGVGYLHSQGVAHRDIKPENLFFDTMGHLKIGDYGASTVYRLPWEATIHMSTGLCGSEPYIAPEQFLGKPYDARLVDIWACGIVYYCLHFQELPWRAAQPSDQLYAAYAAAAAATPPPPLTAAPPATNGAAGSNGSTSTITAAGTGASTTSTSTSTSTAAAPVDRDRHGTNSSLVFPPTISNLSPRACRPLIRKMLEPDPKARCGIEEVLGCAWMRSVEVCWEVGEGARHVHVNARAIAGQ